MSPVAFRQRRTLCLVLAAVALLILAVNPPSALASLGFVGNMFPTGGSTNNLTVGGNFDVYVQVYKAGFTEAGGQGANITCTLSRGTVGYFGGSWSNTTNIAMTYNTQIGNNDEYRGTMVTPAVGLYEFTAFCTDTTDNSTTYQGNGNGKLIVKTSGSNTCSTAAQGNNTVFYDGLNHDTFSTTYRNPGGAAGTNTLNVDATADATRDLAAAQHHGGLFRAGGKSRRSAVNPRTRVLTGANDCVHFPIQVPTPSCPATFRGDRFRECICLWLFTASDFVS